MAAVIETVPPAAGWDVPQAAPRGLCESDFRLVCENGFGDGLNGYAHSMAWFDGKLYVGTTCATFQGMKTNKPVPNLSPWVVLSPDDVYDVDRRAEIWQYTPETSSWRRVYQAPWMRAAGNRAVPRYMGFRGMTVFQSPGDQKPCLYVSTWAPQRAEPPDILRCEDGENFENAPRPPWDTAVRSFRTLQVFKGRVHTTPTGSNRGQGAEECVGSEATIYCTDDIATGVWQAASTHGFGDFSNLTVFEMGTFDDHLYAGTVNPTSGFQLWKTNGDGGPPYRWKRVIHNGAFRGPNNELGLSMCSFKGAMYVGTGIVNGGYHRAHSLGPAGAEIIRVFPDDSWDLVVGNPRVTPEGLKTPISGFSAGFDNLFTGYIWRMMVHEDCLYVGTFSWGNVLPYVPRQVWPDEINALIDRWGLETILRNYGGCALWRTHDGVIWEPVTLSGFGNKYNWGIRNFASTPHGLFVGTANIYGRQVAVQKERKWQYVENSRGGLEIWLGQPKSEGMQ